MFYPQHLTECKKFNLPANAYPVRETGTNCF